MKLCKTKAGLVAQNKKLLRELAKADLQGEKFTGRNSTAKVFIVK
jgi:hypothetical protein